MENSPVEVGIFTSIADADRAVHRLLELGFTKEEITVICSDETKERFFREFEHEDPAGTHTPATAAAGSAIGAVLGGFAALVGAAATGGIALIAAGGIAAWGGAVAGGLIGAMMSRGVEGELANYYNQAVSAGKILVAVTEHGDQVTPRMQRAAQALVESGAEQPLQLREG
jgi:hypothetical protein